MHADFRGLLHADHQEAVQACFSAKNFIACNETMSGSKFPKTVKSEWAYNIPGQEDSKANTAVSAYVLRS